MARMKGYGLMEKDFVAKKIMKINIEDSVQKVPDILETEDGRTFEEKKAEAVQYLQTQTDTTNTFEYCDRGRNRNPHEAKILETGGYNTGNRHYRFA